MARKKKRISPWVANMRAYALPVTPRTKPRPKGKSFRAAYPKSLGYHPIFNQPTDGMTVRAMADRLLDLRRGQGRWPNYSVRWWDKDRRFKRALRLAQKMVEAVP